MKKSFKLLLIAVIAFLVMIPSALALSIDKAPSKYNKQKLETALEKEKITYDFKHTYSDDHVKLYLFYGDGCSYCKRFLEFASKTLMTKYNDSLDIYTFEVWYDDNNQQLYTEIAKELKKSADGVPFMVVGEDSFTGYISTDNDRIMAAIDEQIETKTRVDFVDDFINNGNDTYDADDDHGQGHFDYDDHYFDDYDDHDIIEYEDYNPMPVILFTLIVIISIIAIPVVIVIIIVVVVIILANNSSKKKNNTQ